MILLGACLIDVLAGEYPNALHPVVWMGWVTNRLKRIPAPTPLAQLALGAAIALLVPALFAGGAALLLRRVSYAPLHVLLEVVILKATFAGRGLGKAAEGVRRALARGSLEDARFGLRSLCSRDPSQLGPESLAAASVESVAENASDSFVAPLFFYAVFGAPGAVAYRAVNTLDAMIGYRGRYEYLGKASARLDDLLNVVPARLTAALLVLAGWLRGQPVRNALRVWRRDARLTASPNAGHPMAAMAGLLRVELVKEGHYRLGDAERAVSHETIAEACGAPRLALVIAALVFGGLHALVR